MISPWHACNVLFCILQTMTTYTTENLLVNVTTNGTYSEELITFIKGKKLGKSSGVNMLGKRRRKCFTVLQLRKSPCVTSSNSTAAMQVAMCNFVLSVYTIVLIRHALPSIKDYYTKWYKNTILEKHIDRHVNLGENHSLIEKWFFMVFFV